MTTQTVRKPMRPTYRTWLLIVLPMLLAFAALGFNIYKKNHPDVAEKVGVGITGYNFTNEGVQEFYVNGGYGSNLPPYGGGGATSCCVLVPEKWAPELTVAVDWSIGHYDLPIDKILAMPNDEVHSHFVRRTLSKTVPIERYEHPGRVQVFFFPNDEVKVYSSDIGLGNHDGHPSGLSSPRDPNKPKEQ